MKIFLIGFMGSGKTTLGKRLAERLGLDFVDMDEWLEKETGKSIAALFETEGEEAFRMQEAEMLRKCQGLQHTIIATGGGTPCFYENLKWMNENGITLYLSVQVKNLIERLEKAKDGRPLLAGKTKPALAQFIEEKLTGREKYYQQAQFQCQADGCLKEIVDSLFAYFGRFVNQKIYNEKHQ